MPKQPNKKKMPTWVKWLAIVVGSFFALILILALIAWLVFCDMRNAWTMKERHPLPEVVVTKEDANRLAPTYKKVKQILSGKASGEATFVVESDDIDKIIAIANEGRHLKEMARIRVEGDKVVVTTDVNLNKLPLMQGRYLSGDFTWDVTMDDKAWHFHLDSVKVKDRDMPEWILKHVNKKIASKEDMLRNQIAPEWTHKLKSLSVQDGKVTVVIK